MAKTTESNAPVFNLLLAALSNREYLSLFPELELVALNYGEVIYYRDEIIRYVYFPNRGIISLLAAAEGGSTLEVGMVGKEGFVGLPIFLGVKTSNNHAIVQGAGFAMRMKSTAFLRKCQKSTVLPRLLQRFTHSMLTQASQSAVCNCFHPIETRLARWLLMTSDRLETNEFHLTQEFLSNMMGVRREAVNKSAVILQQQQLITYSRGNIVIVNRQELEIKACLCYALLKAEEIDFTINNKV